MVNEIDSQTHSGMRTQLSKFFIKTGKLDKKYGKLLVQLYDWRQQGDYKNLFDFSEDTVNQLFEPANEMLSQLNLKLITHCAILETALNNNDRTTN